MSTPGSLPEKPDSAAKLALAREAYSQFRSRCFWFMKKDIEITEEDLPYLCARLRADGGREGFLLADRLCR